MNKELQNLAWKCLPKEAREYIRKSYRYLYKNCDYNRINKGNLGRLFGYHNLTSGEEPPELLFVERKKIINICKDAPINIEQSVLYELFGDKCLPDKELSAQTSPNFKVGDKVKVISGDHLGEIAMITKVVYDGFCKLSDIDGFFSPIRLKLYTEPEIIITEERAKCTLFPSSALYEKYPLDPYSAWMEWKSERTPKRWRAEKGEYYWRVVFDKDLGYHITDSVDVRDSIDNACYEGGNYFKDAQTALQATEAVRECLKKFHEQNIKE